MIGNRPGTKALLKNLTEKFGYRYRYGILDGKPPKNQ